MEEGGFEQSFAPYKNIWIFTQKILQEVGRVEKSWKFPCIINRQPPGVQCTQYCTWMKTFHWQTFNWHSIENFIDTLILKKYSTFMYFEAGYNKRECCAKIKLEGMLSSRKGFASERGFRGTSGEPINGREIQACFGGLQRKLRRFAVVSAVSGDFSLICFGRFKALSDVWRGLRGLLKGFMELSETP